jgi:hypothetical protein
MLLHEQMYVQPCCLWLFGDHIMLHADRYDGPSLRYRGSTA